MKVRDAMSTNVKLAKPNQTIREAAKVMAEIDAGVLPVTDGDRLLGMITDRDIAVRAVARGLGPETSIREVMTSEVKYAFDDEDLEDVAHNMADIKVRRLPVVNRDKRLVGIISIGDLSASAPPRQAGQALESISRHTGQHSQLLH